LLLTELGTLSGSGQQRFEKWLSALTDSAFPSLDEVFSLANCRRRDARMWPARWWRLNCVTASTRHSSAPKKGKTSLGAQIKMSPPQAAKLIHQAGGLAVLAHRG